MALDYLRDGMARMSAIVETFETATTWDRVEALYHAVNAEIGEVIRSVTGAAKGALDPTGILKPGVLLDPRR